MTCTKVSAGDALWESLCKAETVVLLSAGWVVPGHERRTRSRTTRFPNWKRQTS
jgi:hypothetical protein